MKITAEKEKFGLAFSRVKVGGPSENVRGAESSDGSDGLILVRHSGDTATLVIVKDDGVRRSLARGP